MPPQTPQAVFRTPDTILASADSLLAHDDPRFNRAVLLESMAALESFVGSLVFDLLQSRLDAPILDLLRDKTSTDLDTRLSVLASVATQIPIRKNGSLWRRYLEAKEIWDAVAHAGRMVSRDEAAKAVQLVRDWIVYLNSTGELDLSLFKIKQHIEKKGKKYSDYTRTEVTQLILQYFVRSGATEIQHDADARVGKNISEADVVQRFGQYRVVIEVRHISRHDAMHESQIDDAIAKTHSRICRDRNTSAAIIFVYRGERLKQFKRVERRLKGRISVVFVGVG